MTGKLWEADTVFTRILTKCLAIERCRWRRNYDDANRNGRAVWYAPENTVAAMVGVETGPLRAEAEYVRISSQFGDNLNTVAISANGQRDQIPAYGIWNFALNWEVGKQLTLFGTVKNVANKTYIVDLIRGILPGSPRLVQFGGSLRF